MSISLFRWLLLVFSLFFAMGLNLSWGSVALPLSKIWAILWDAQAGTPTQAVIIRDLRLPATLMTLAAGAALGVAGLIMQTLFRNPIASPYLLGVSAGGALGVALGVLVLGWVGTWALAGLGMLGSGAVMLLILLVSLRLRTSGSLLIVGMMIGSTAGALVELMQYFSESASLMRYTVWSQGSTLGSSWEEVALLLPLTVLLLLVLMGAAKGLDGLLLGEAYAESMGVRVRGLRLVLISAAALLSGLVTAFCGMIGFVGIIAPHLARVLWRTHRHATLLFATAGLGALLLLLCLWLSVALGASAGRVLPLNVFTALVGVPMVVYLVLRGRELS